MKTRNKTEIWTLWGIPILLALEKQRQGDPGIQGHPQLPSKFEDSLSYVSLFPQKPKRCRGQVGGEIDFIDKHQNISTCLGKSYHLLINNTTSNFPSQGKSFVLLIKVIYITLKF